MSKKNLIFALSAIVVFQIIVLAAEYTNAVYPLFIGQEVALKTKPIDPRSMFRGNYARLSYEISEIPKADINAERNARNGKVVYVKLKKSGNGIYSYQGASLNKPSEGVFIRGRIWSKERKVYRVKYGIEALFAPKEKAVKLEKRLRNKAVAIVMLAKNGKAALKGVVDESTIKELE